MPKVRKLSQQEVQAQEMAPEPLSGDSAVSTPSGTPTIDDTCTHVAAWVYERGWIEIGADEYSRSFIRVLDEGGMVWEGKTSYPSLDAALRAADSALAQLEAAGKL
jgi:hypothetical protein